MLESLTCLSSSRQLIEFGSIWLFLSFIWAFAESTFLTMCGINIHSQHQQQKTRSKEKKMNFSTFLPTHKTWTKICCHFFPVSEMKKKEEKNSWDPSELKNFLFIHRTVKRSGKKQHSNRTWWIMNCWKMFCSSQFFCCCMERGKGWRHENSRGKSSTENFYATFIFRFFCIRKKKFFRFSPMEITAQLPSFSRFSLRPLPL